MPISKNIPLQITGPSYEDRSKPLSSQQCKNFYPEVISTPGGAKSEYILRSWPGLIPISESTLPGKDRGMTTMGGYIFRVVGEVLYKVAVSGAHTPIGNIPGATRCYFATDGQNLVIVAEKVWIWNGSSLQEITDPNIVGAETVTYLNGAYIYSNVLGNRNFFGVSEPNDPTQMNGLDITAAESRADPIVRVYSFQQTLYVFGENTIETYYSSTASRPPYIRVDGALLEVGCASGQTVANTDNYLYWLGDDYSVYRTTGNSKEIVSTPAISAILREFARVDDSFAYVVTVDAQNFYVIHFQQANKTLALSESQGTSGWFEISSGFTDGIYQGSSLVEFKGDTWVADSNNTKLYKLDVNTFTNNNEPIQRRRVSNSVDALIFNSPGTRMQISRLELMLEKGVGLLQGQGEDPKILLEVSTDGGRSFSHVGWARSGRLGEHTIRAEFWFIKSGYDFMFRITCSDPISWTIYRAAFDAKLVGR